DMSSRHPRSRVQEARAIPLSKYDDGFTELRKRETVHLVFGQENIACSNIQRRKVAGRNCEVRKSGNRNAAVEQAEPHKGWLCAESVSLRELLGGCQLLGSQRVIVRFQHDVEQFRE